MSLVHPTPPMGTDDRLHRFALMLIVLVTVFVTACGPRLRQPKVPAAPSTRIETGLASWYGPKFHGRTTANGENYNMLGLTAAHKTLPFGTYVRVTNLVNGRSLVVRVNDRGPFIRGRVIDLSYAAAKVLDMTRAGIVKVRLDRLAPGDGARVHERQAAMIRKAGIRSWSDQEYRVLRSVDQSLKSDG